jgi:hypothetical protein
MRCVGLESTAAAVEQWANYLVARRVARYHVFMSTTLASREGEILSRVVLADEPGFETEFARSLLRLTFDPRDVDRMNELAERAREGELTEDERLELNSYERVGTFLALLKSKARVSLRDADS